MPATPELDAMASPQAGTTTTATCETTSATLETTTMTTTPNRRVR
jgi:hypothetical protein